MSIKSTKTTRRKIVQAVKGTTYGVAISLKPNLSSNNYGPNVKRYGPHRKAVADEVRRLRHKKRHGMGISPWSKAVRGIESARHVK